MYWSKVSKPEQKKILTLTDAVLKYSYFHSKINGCERMKWLRHSVISLLVIKTELESASVEDSVPQENKSLKSQ